MLSQDPAANDASDAELARRIARGDAVAEERELCRRFAPRIRLYGLRHLRDEDRARDLVQSVLLAAIEALRRGRVEDVERIDRYVLATCRHLASRARREAARATPVDDAALDVDAVMPRTDAVDVGALFMCMGALDARQRTVLELSFYGEKPASEIAAALGTTEGNVRVVRHRAMALLRECLEGAS